MKARTLEVKKNGRTMFRFNSVGALVEAVPVSRSTVMRALKDRRGRLIINGVDFYIKEENGGSWS